MELTLLHRDEHLAAFAKPSGLVVHRGWANDRITALDLARRALGVRVYPIHRLDRGTSGVMVFALSSGAAAAMQRVFDAGGVRKVYLALVRDTAPESGTIDYPIPNDEDGPRVEARTEFRRLWVGDRASLVEVRPQTGRLHQVRRHMKHIRHPVLGDTNYGDGRVNRYHRDRYGLSRLALHASRIEFTEPLTGTLFDVCAPVPGDLSMLFDALGIPSVTWAIDLANGR